MKIMINLRKGLIFLGKRCQNGEIGKIEYAFKGKRHLSELNQVVLRKMETRERNFCFADMYTNFMVEYRIESKLDLFHDLSKTKQAIELWKKTQPFLRANIVKKPNEDDFYFALNESSPWHVNLQNVHFLRLKAANGSVAATRPAHDLEHLYLDLFKLLSEKSLSQVLDVHENSPLLWKMFILELDLNKNNKSLREYEYKIFLQLHHSISDALSLHHSFLNLLNLFADQHENKLNREVKEMELFAGVDAHFQDLKKIPFERLQLPQLPSVPSFVNPTRAKENSFVPLKVLNAKNAKDYVLYDVDKHKTFMSLTELYETSKTNNIKVKTPSFVIESAKLMNKCKLENVKITSFFNILFCHAINRLYDRHRAQLEHLVFENQVELRTFKTPPIDRNSQGYCVGDLTTAIDNNLIRFTDGGRLEIDRFWSLAKKASEQMTQRVMYDMDKYFSEDEQAQNSSKEMSAHFTFSNPGKIKTPTCGKFNIVSAFGIGSIAETTSYSLVNLTVYTINEKICLMYYYNSFFIDNFLIDELDQFAHELLNQVL